MSETITLNDGTILNGYCIESSGILWCYMYQVSLAEAFELLIEPVKTKKINVNRNGQKTIFTGYKHLFCIREEDDGMISAGLKKV